MFIRRNGGVPVWQEPKKKKKEFDITKYTHSTHTHRDERDTDIWELEMLDGGHMLISILHIQRMTSSAMNEKKQNKTKIFQKTLEAKD